MRGIKIEFSGALSQTPHIELQKPEPAAELGVMFTSDPADRIVRLIDVIGKFRIATIVKHLAVGTAEEFDTRESRVINSGESNFRRVSLAQAVGNLAAKAPAETDQELVDQRGAENVIVAKSNISGVLGRA